MSSETIIPDYRFIEEVERDETFRAQACFQCRKCTSGCPVTFAMDLYPDEVIRLVIMGQGEKVLACNTIWVCSGCETCTTRCPNEVKIAELMDRLKEMAVERKIPSPRPGVLVLHQTFLNNIRKHGRMFESTLLPVYLLRSGEWARKIRDGSWPAEAKLGWKMFRRKRMPLLPKKFRAKVEMERIIGGPESKKSRH